MVLGEAHKRGANTGNLRIGPERSIRCSSKADAARIILNPTCDSPQRGQRQDRNNTAAGEQ
jgi:hypothetical protein